VLLSLDLGTTNCKAVAFDERGSELARSEAAYPTYRPGPGAHVQRPAEWLEAASRALRGAGKALGDDAGRAAGLALSAWGPGLVLLSRDGRVLNEYSPTWQDLRSRQHGELLMAKVGPDWVGGGIPASGFPAKLAWAMEEWPDLTEEAAFALGVKDLLVYWLTGELATEPSSGPFGEGWPEEAFSAIGWAMDRLPPVLAPTEIGGQIKAELASELGLPLGMPVIMGVNDGASATLGAGCSRVGDAVASLGTNGVLRALIRQKPAASDCLARGLFRYPFVEGLWVTGGFTLSGADALRWLVQALSGQVTDQAYELLLGEATEISPGSEGVIFLPYLIGRGSPSPTTDAAAAFVGLRSSHGRGHLVRAVLEGVAYALYDISSAFDNLGLQVERLALTGGGARSELWRSIIAGVFRKPAYYAPGSSNLGAAMVLAVALGIYSSFQQAIEEMTAAAPVAPNPDATVYMKGFTRFSVASRRVLSLSDTAHA
jgi:xylulokinase